MIRPTLRATANVCVSAVAPVLLAALPPLDAAVDVTVSAIATAVAAVAPAAISLLSAASVVTCHYRYTVIKFYEIPGFYLTKLSWDWDWVNYSRSGRVW